MFHGLFNIQTMTVVGKHHKVPFAIRGKQITLQDENKCSVPLPLVDVVFYGGADVSVISARITTLNYI